MIETQAAIVFSLMATSNHNRTNPRHWLGYVLETLPTPDPANYSSLLPFLFSERSSV